MNIIEKVINYINSLDQKNFYKYLAIFGGVLSVLISILLWYYYSSLTYWKRQVKNTNEMRTQIKEIVDRDELVLKQRQEINKLLTENPDFKIRAYFDELESRLGLTRNRQDIDTMYEDYGDPEYREVVLTAKFDTMNMKQLTELLNEIEHNNRVYIKSLEIIKSKKIPNTIDVTLSIATLQRKELTEGAE